MDSLRIDRNGYTLVDQVEEKLIQYFKEQGLRPGSSIPNENELSASLGTGRTVLREALSRFKMTGMIQSRTKRGMTLAEPSLLASMRRSINPLLMSDATLYNIFEMRIVLDLGMSHTLFKVITPQLIADLEKIVTDEERLGNDFNVARRTEFHKKLYETVGNTILSEFQELISPAIDYIVAQHQEAFEGHMQELSAKGLLVTHRTLLDCIKAGDEEGYRQAVIRHFAVYSAYLDRVKAE